MPKVVLNFDGLIALMRDLQGGNTQENFAAQLNISPQYLSDIYKRRREPGQSVLCALNITKEIGYSLANHTQGDVGEKVKEVTSKRKRKPSSR